MKTVKELREAISEIETRLLEHKEYAKEVSEFPEKAGIAKLLISQAENRINDLGIALDFAIEASVQKTVAHKALERLDEGKKYLMAADPDFATIEEALQAFGFNANGLG